MRFETSSRARALVRSSMASLATSPFVRDAERSESIFCCRRLPFVVDGPALRPGLSSRVLPAPVQETAGSASHPSCRPCHNFKPLPPEVLAVTAAVAAASGHVLEQNGECSASKNATERGTVVTKKSTARFCAILELAPGFFTRVQHPKPRRSQGSRFPARLSRRSEMTDTNWASAEPQCVKLAQAEMNDNVTGAIAGGAPKLHDLIFLPYTPHPSTTPPKPAHLTHHPQRFTLHSHTLNSSITPTHLLHTISTATVHPPSSVSPCTCTVNENPASCQDHKSGFVFVL